MACVDLPAFPLQILRRSHPEWRDLPAAVIDEDRPQGRLLWVNERARAERVLPGMRYAAALALTRELRAGVIAPAMIEAEIEFVAGRLRFYSPEVEPSRDEPGTFWLGAGGLGLLHPEFPAWARLMRDDLRRAEYVSRIAVGFTRFGCYATARASSGIIVFGDPPQEQAAVRRIRIDRITRDAKLRDLLARLGIHELGGFLDLPPAGIRRRFGEEAAALHRQACGEAWTPLAPEIPEEPHERQILFDHAESDVARLLRAIDEDLRALLERLRRRDRALASLAVELVFDHPGADGARTRLETLRPAAPTREIDLLLDLLRLRLESRPFPSGVVELRLEAGFVAASREQLTLFPESPRRDLEAANRALARLRAEHGDDAVCAARLAEAHLPEGRAVLEPLERLAPAEPRKVHTIPLVRRRLTRPEPVTLSRAGEVTGGEAVEGGGPLARTIHGLGVVREAKGPFLVSGGWWRRAVVRRYWYVRVGEEGSWLWVYHDGRRDRWFRQGEVG